jgi:hypothetical protein
MWRWMGHRQRLLEKLQKRLGSEPGAAVNHSPSPPDSGDSSSRHGVTVTIPEVERASESESVRARDSWLLLRFGPCLCLLLVSAARGPQRVTADRGSRPMPSRYRVPCAQADFTSRLLHLRFSCLCVCLVATCGQAEARAAEGPPPLPSAEEASGARPMSMDLGEARPMSIDLGATSPGMSGMPLWFVLLTL